MAKRTSVFDDPTTEIQELTAVIKQDITALNSAVVDLQLHSNARNESGNSDTTSHSTTVVDDLKNRLMTATKEFKEVLTMRTEVRLARCWLYLPCWPVIFLNRSFLSLNLAKASFTMYLWLPHCVLKLFCRYL